AVREGPGMARLGAARARVRGDVPDALHRLAPAGRDRGGGGRGDRAASRGLAAATRGGRGAAAPGGAARARARLPGRDETQAPLAVASGIAAVPRAQAGVPPSRAAAPRRVPRGARPP